MNEGEQNFEEKDPAGVTPHGAFRGPSGYGEVSYSVDGETVDSGTLGQFSVDAKSEYALTHPGEFPFESLLLEATTPEQYKEITAKLELFYSTQIAEVLEGKKPATVADMEVVEFAQAIQGAAEKGKDEGGQPAQEISTSEEALSYLKQPGITEKLGDKARKLLAIAFSATAFAAAMPASAQGIGMFNLGQLGTYAVQRGVQEGQIEIQARLQLKNLKERCDYNVQSLEGNMEAQIANNSGAIQMQIETIGMQMNVSHAGINLLAADAPEQFRAQNPEANPRQIAAFTQMRQIALNGNMMVQQMRRSADIQVKQVIRSCDLQMRQLSDAASYNRTSRVAGDVGNVILMPRR